MRKRTRAILIALGLLVALLGLVGWQQRDALLQAALEWALARAGDALVVEAPRASFSGRIEAGRVLYRSPGFTLRADAVRMRLDPVSLWRRELLASELRADRVAIRLEPQPPPAQPAPAGPVLPERLGLPLPAAIQALAIGLLEFSAPELELRARSIDGQVAFDGSHWRIERLRAAVETPGLETPCRPQCTLALRGALGSERPFALSATLEAQGQLQDSALRARIAVDGQLHAETGLPLGARVEGRWQALALDVDARLDPFAPTARGKLRLSNAEPGPLDAQRWPVARVATGFEYSADALRLTDIAIHDRADAEQATVTGSGTLSTRDLAGRFELAAEALDLSRLHGRLLGSALSGAIELVLGDREIRFDASLREARAPVAAKLRGLARPDRVLLEHVELDAYGGHARASASLELTGARSLQAQAQFERFDPSRIAQLPAMRLAGRLEADLKLEPAPAGTVNLTLADSRLHGRALSLRARASGALRKPAVELDASLGPSKLAASGRLDADDRKARIDWKLDLAEPQLIDPRLEGRVRASGRFAGDPLAPQVELRAEADRLAYDTVELRAVALKITGEPRRHRIELAGRHAGAGFRLDASGALPGRLDQLDAASGWTGRIDVLRIEAPVPVSLSAPAELAVGAGRASLGPTRLAVGAGHLQAQQLSLRDGSIDSSGSFARIAPAPWLQWLGITERTSGMGIADLALSGEWSLRYRPDAPAAERLAGRIGIERSAGDLSIRLPAGDGTSRPRPLGLERVRVDAVIDTDATDLSLALRSLRGTSVDASARITVDPDQPFGMPVTIVSSGRLGGLEPAYWLALLRPGVLAPGVDASSLRLGAGWSLQWRPRSGAADALSGEAFVERESGDVTVKAGSTTIALQLGATRLGLRAAEGGLEARLGLASGRELGIDGSARAGLAAVPGSIAIARTAPWSGRLEGSLALGPLARLVTDELLLDGRLKASVELAGTPQQPLLQGSIEGDGLQVVHPESGLRLIDGSLRAQVAGQNIEVRHWVMYMPDPAASAAPDTAAPARPETAAPAKPETGAPAKPGAAPAAGRERDRTAERARLTATGTLPLDPARPAQLDFRAERLALPISPEQRLVVSGDGSLALREGRVDLGVRARADEALIRLLGKSRPSVSEDVVVQHAAGVEPPPAARTGAPVLPFSARIEVDLGDRFRVSGEGISARLAGRLELEASGVGTLLAHGDVRIVEGRYTQLGTTLIIEHGLLRFSGPIDNPGLDILATRENLPVRVWAQISGTAQDPAITLGSDEPMTDAQRLAWLTLGAPLDEDPGAAQSAALQAAARALIGSVTGAGEGESLAQTLGVDVLAVRSDVTGASFLTVGKRLSERLFVSYEQGLQGVWNIVRVQLQLSRRLQLNMQAGSESAVDLMLTVPFN